MVAYCQHLPFNQTDGKLKWFYLIPVGSITATQCTTKNPSQGKVANCRLLEAKERVFLQFAGFQFKIKFVEYCWSSLQSSNLWSITLYYVISKQLTASEDIRVSKPYTTSKAYY